MRFFFLIMCWPLICLAETRNITVLNSYGSAVFFDDQVTHNIVAFEYLNQDNDMHRDIDNGTPYENDQKTIKLGIATTQNVLVSVVWEYQSLSLNDPSSLIQSVELLDVNQDNLLDIIINYNDVDGDFPDQVISSFLINNANVFSEISETFVKSRYAFIEGNQLKYETPLTMFGRPYIEEEPQKDSRFWVDFYEFDGQNLINVNQKHRSFFEVFRQQSNQQMADLLSKIKSFKMTDEATINQLQLEEYFNQITELKTIIYRSDKILY